MALTTLTPSHCGGEFNALALPRELGELAGAQARRPRAWCVCASAGPRIVSEAHLGSPILSHITEIWP